DSKSVVHISVLDRLSWDDRIGLDSRCCRAACVGLRGTVVLNRARLRARFAHGGSWFGFRGARCLSVSDFARGIYPTGRDVSDAGGSLFSSSGVGAESILGKENRYRSRNGGRLVTYVGRRALAFDSNGLPTDSAVPG